MKKLWIIPTVILSLNILILIFGFATNSGVIGGLMGSTFALMFDPILFVSSLILGFVTSSKDFKLYLLTTFGGALVLTVIFHFMINTSFLLTDIVRFNNILILSSIVFLIKRKFF
jgi:hypothetical protein